MFLRVAIDQQMCLSIDDQIINYCQQVTLLGVTIDSKLNFDKHIPKICKGVNKKVRAFSRLKNYLRDTQTKQISIIVVHLGICL